jgi:AraC-like DNA-binding protein
MAYKVGVMGAAGFAGVELVRLLVQHPEWSVDTIAEQCGFSSRNYFHRIFLKLTGQTPSQYVASAQEK